MGRDAILLLLLSATTIAEKIFTNEFAVKLVHPFNDAAALKIADNYGFVIHDQLPAIKTYVFKHDDVPARTKRSADGFEPLRELRADPSVASVRQQNLLDHAPRTALRRKRRTSDVVHGKQLPHRRVLDRTLYRNFTSPKSNSKRRDFHSKRFNDFGVVFTDPLWKDQWYLFDKGQLGGPGGSDLRVMQAWASGYTGKGVTVTVLDDGLDHKHPELSHNYDPVASWDMNGNDDDPAPDLNKTINGHGTRCGGEIAGRANNSHCGVGIAFNANIGGIRVLDGHITDAGEAKALNHQMQHVDIYSASWGPTDDGTKMEAPDPLSSEALVTGVEQGRGGKGSIFVWATGNGGAEGDSCAADGYVSSRYSISIGSITHDGRSTYYMEHCPSTMAVVYTGGAHTQYEEDEDSPTVKIVTADPFDDCTENFQGTSAAAPLGAGCLALVLEANPELTWRDLQHVVVHGARIPNGVENAWAINGAGLHVSPRFGFGVMDCSKMVQIAQAWRPVGAYHVCEAPEKRPHGREGEIRSRGRVTSTVTTDGCAGQAGRKVAAIEHVEIDVDLSFTRRGDVEIRLVSPSGHENVILPPREPDDDPNGINFTFMSVHYWGEEPTGEWKLTVTDRPHTDQAQNQGRLKAWTLRLYGTAERPQRVGDSPEQSALPRAADAQHVMAELQRDAGGVAEENDVRADVDALGTEHQADVSDGAAFEPYDAELRRLMDAELGQSQRTQIIDKKDVALEMRQRLRQKLRRSRYGSHLSEDSVEDVIQRFMATHRRDIERRFQKHQRRSFLLERSQDDPDDYINTPADKGYQVDNPFNEEGRPFRRHMKYRSKN